MNAERQSDIGVLGAEACPSHGGDGKSVRRGPRPAAEYNDGLYRYVPVPPVYRDAEGYPLEDGMSQRENHQKETSYWCDVLQRQFPWATVCSDLPMHYRRGDGNRAVVPDLLLALSAPWRGDRSSYKLWENPVPDLVMEMLSPGNWREDDGPKRRTYEHVGVREYWLFDEGGRHLSAPLVGYRLYGGRYRRTAANAAGRLPSDVLGLELHVHGGRVRFHDPATGRDLQTSDEDAEGRAAAEACRDAAEADRVAAEAAREAAEDGRDAAQAARDVAEAGRDAAEAAREVAEADRAAAEQRAGAAERRAEAAELELARLRKGE